jgi:Protein of unknown function (DUF3048) N-terminal domain/Protein of unknown function (DUF3048) C-terminal domain
MPADDPSSGAGPGGGAASESGIPPARGSSSTPSPGAPRIVTRQEIRKARRRRRARWYVLALVVVLLAGTGAAVALTRKTPGPAPGVAAGASPTVHATCPLTGAPSPTGSVPARPALAVKVGNYTGDRPSAGLNQADIVFEEPVEGGITRLVAVFQCQAPSLVGDLRSAREPDVGILSQLSDPMFAHVGGIQPVLNLLASAPLIDKNLYYSNSGGSAIILKSGRVAPYSSFADTSSLWALDSSDTSPPAPVFAYSTSLPAGAVPGSGASVHIPFSSSSDVTWQWSAPVAKYLRFYSGEPDKLLDGTQSAATNVVIMSVESYTGPWLENDVGGYEVEVTATGSGPLVVMRNGVAISGTWTRPNVNQPAALTTSSGTPIALQPGNTWVELVPDGITVTPSAAPPSTAPSSSS